MNYQTLKEEIQKDYGYHKLVSDFIADIELIPEPLTLLPLLKSLDLLCKLRNEELRLEAYAQTLKKRIKQGETK